MTEEIRIGGGPPRPTGRQPTPPHRGAVFVLAITATVVLVAAAVAGFAYFLGRSDATTAATPAVVPSATSGAFVLPTADIGEEAACKLLFSTVTDAIDQITALGQDPTGLAMDKQVFRTSLGNLEGTKAFIPQDMRSEVESMAVPMRQIDAIWKGESPNGDLVLSGFKDGARRYLARCTKYGI